MKFYYVYILFCNDDTLYVGVTSDIDRRVMEHNMVNIQKPIRTVEDRFY